MSIHEPGICPRCGLELGYGMSHPEGGMLTYECFCTACGFTGTELYALNFIGHVNSVDPSGTLIE